jgi:hypothetical protein
MLVSEFLDRVSYALRGQDDDAPTVGTEEATYWISIFNRRKDELYRDSRLRLTAGWKESAPNEPGTVATAGTTTLTGTSTYFTDYQVGDKITVSGETVRTIATIVSDTSLTVTVAFSNTASGKTFTHSTIIAASDQSYSVHRDFLYPSDKVTVTDTDSKVHDYTLIKPQERSSLQREVYLHGVNPYTLTFTSTIDSTEDIVGGTLSIPGFYLPADVSLATDTIPLDDPNWGVMATAAEVAFNDVVYEEKAPDLNDKANALFSAMLAKNRAGTFGNPRRMPYRGYRIGVRESR